MTWCACSFCLEFVLLFLLSCFSSDMVCLQSFLLLLCSFLVNFTNLSWKDFNIILIYWVELYYYLRCFCFCFYSCFLFCFCLAPGVGVGAGGCISIHEKDRGLRQHTINYICTSLLHFVFQFPPTLIAVSECDVLWTATCTVISLVGSVKSRFYF